jgi:hypothetical protein
VRHPRHELLPDTGRAAPEERINDANARREFPAADNHDQEQDTQAIDHEALPPTTDRGCLYFHAPCHVDRLIGFAA